MNGRFNGQQLSNNGKPGATAETPAPTDILTAGRAAALLRAGTLHAFIEDNTLFVTYAGKSDELDVVAASLLNANLRVNLSAAGNGLDRQNSQFYRAALPASTIARMSDRRLFWELLSGRLCHQRVGLENLIARQASVEASEVNGEDVHRILSSGSVWVCKVEVSGATGTAFRLGWVARESGRATPSTRSDPAARAATEEENGQDQDGQEMRSRPGKELAGDLFRLQQALRNLGLRDGKVTVARRQTVPIDARQRYIRIATPYSEAYWSARSLESLRGIIETDDRTVEHRVFGLEASLRGLLSLSYRLPGSPTERVAGYAIRTLYALLRQGGRGLWDFVDSIYRSSQRFQAFVTVYNAVGEAEQRRLDGVLGERRREQIVTTAIGALPRSPGQAMVEPWTAAAAAAELLIREYVASGRRRGYALDVESKKIVDTYYLRPRSDALRSLWDRARRNPEMETMLEEGRLSRLRAYGRTLPRSVLVDAAAGTSESVKRRLSSIFSRRGRLMFLEDVDAVEGAIQRKEWIEWERLLSAQKHLSVLMKKIQ